MKRIVKSPEPEDFREWKEKWRSNELEPGWGEFDTKPIKQAVKQALLKEQGYICCFCEINVSMDNGHIAHLRDQAGHPKLALEYDNLFYSCTEQPKTEPQTSGHAQKNAILPISPLADDCESRFLYTMNGKIHPKSDADKDAAETVRILNLNAKRLAQSREQAFLEVFNERHERKPDEFQKWIDGELEKIDDHFTEFWTVKKYVSTMPTFVFV